jgi:hypothetical protein
MAMVVRPTGCNPEDGGDLGGHIGVVRLAGQHVRRRLQPLLACRRAKTTAATASTSRATARPASMPAPTWKAGITEEQLDQLPPGSRRQGPVELSAPEADAATSGSSRRSAMGLGPLMAIYQARLPEVPACPRHRRHRATARSGCSAATARWTSRNRSAPSAWPHAREAGQPRSSSSTATCSAWTARCVATARSSRSSKANSAARAGTSSS